MNAIAETSSAGAPVEIRAIDRELKKFWAQGDENYTRASLINLAVYSEAPNSLARNTDIVRQIAEKYACRAIVIAADPSAHEDRAEAWINAHCHVNGAGKKQTCSEQISFSLAGPSAKMLPSIVFSQLDSDLPFYLWWQGEFHDSMDAQLFAWVDRLIYNSQTWSDCRAQLQRVETALAEAKQRIVLCDLNWTSLVQIRLAIAQFFDQPKMRSLLDSIERVEIDFAPHHRTTALLLVGWLSAQLEWKIDSGSDGGEFVFVNSIGKKVPVRLSETGGRAISRCSLFVGTKELRVAHSEDCDSLKVLAVCDGAEKLPHRMPAAKTDSADLLAEELLRGGPHRVYLRAINCVRELL